MIEVRNKEVGGFGFIDEAFFNSSRFNDLVKSSYVDFIKDRSEKLDSFKSKTNYHKLQERILKAREEDGISIDDNDVYLAIVSNDFILNAINDLKLDVKSISDIENDCLSYYRSRFISYVFEEILKLSIINIYEEFTEDFYDGKFTVYFTVDIDGKESRGLTIIADGIYGLNVELKEAV